MIYIAASRDYWTEGIADHFRNFPQVTVTEKPLRELEPESITYFLPSRDLEELRENEKRLNLVNSVESIVTSLDKLKTSLRLIGAEINTPPTFIGSNFQDLKSFVEKKGKVILKERHSCGGEGHFILTQNNKDIQASRGNKKYVLEEGEEKRIKEARLIVPAPFYAQELILEKGDFNDTVYRTYVVGGKVKFSVKRINRAVKSLEDSIINVARGAEYEFMGEVPAEMENLSLRTAKEIGFDIGAVDLVRDEKGKFYVIEINLDSHRQYICRKFMQTEGYCKDYDFNKQIVQRLVEIEKATSEI